MKTIKEIETYIERVSVNTITYPYKAINSIGLADDYTEMVVSKDGWDELADLIGEEVLDTYLLDTEAAAPSLYTCPALLYYFDKALMVKLIAVKKGISW